MDDESAQRAANRRRPRFGGRATGGDADETGEDAVAHGDQVPDVVQRVVQNHGGNATTGGGERRGDGGTRDDASVIGDAAFIRDEGELRARVEAVPAEPEDEGAEDDERGGVTWHRVHATVGSKATGARTDDPRAHQTGDTASQVNDARSGEIEHAATGEKFSPPVASYRPPRTEPTLSRPAPVHDDRVDKRAEKEGVAEVRLELGAFRDGARHDRRRRGGKRPLEQVRGDVVIRGNPLHRKVSVTDERVHASSFAGLTKSKAVAQIEPRQRANAGVEHVFNQNILRVLASHRSSAQHREAGLHEEHQVR